jgi:hypothetical protein
MFLMVVSLVFRFNHLGGGGDIHFLNFSPKTSVLKEFVFNVQ